MILFCALPGKIFRTFVWLLAFAAVTAQAQVQTRSEFVEGEVIVTFKPSATQSAAQSVLQKKSLQFARRFGRISAIRQRQIGLVKKDGKTTAELVRQLQADPTVESVEPNYLRWVHAAPNDTRFNDLWALRNTGQTLNQITGTSGADIKFLDAWEKARPSTGEIVVGVIDTGLDRTHADLAPRLWQNPLEIPNNNIDDDGNGYVDDYYGYDFAEDFSDIFDSGEHGTHVSGTIAAQGSNGQGIIGVNDHVKIMTLKVSDDGDSISSAAVIEALEYAVDMKQHGIPLVAINASFGGGNASNQEREAITAAGSAGIILCVAAGNEGTNNNTTETYPASYRLSNMIVVAWSDSKDALSADSNYGSTTVDLAAPGDNILSARPALTTVKIGSKTYNTSILLYGGVTQGLSGKIYDCGIGNTGQFPAAVSGHIALIARGTLTFAEKLANAQAAGASAAIIYNNEPGLFSGTLGTSSNWIPVRTLSQADGLALKAMALPVTGSISVESRYQYLDGTSMAAPHVTGAVAFAALNFPNETLTQRKQRILAAVDVKPSLQGKVITGGRLNLNRVVDTDLDGVGDWQTSLLTITNSSHLRGGVVGMDYDITLLTGSGTGPFTFTVSGGNLPSGLALESTGLLTGTPTQPGTFTFTVEVTDDAGRNGSKSFTLVIAAQPPQIASSPLPQGSSGAPYSAPLSATGGTGPYSWSLSTGTLPAGMVLSTTGILSGTPATAGTATFTVQLVDANQLTAEKELSLTVLQSPITITNKSVLPYGLKSESYSQVLSAEGGTAPYEWTLASGSLPAGVSLSPLGVLSGKPTTPSVSSFRIQVRDDAKVVTSKTFSLTIESAYFEPTMNPLELGSTYVGAAYSASVSATDYPKTFTVKGLPKGLAYSSKTRMISGRPAISGDFTVTVTATNPAGSSEATAVLTVRALDPGWIGSFTGIIGRDSTVNLDLGSRLTLTTTSLGAFTLKIVTGATAKSAKGYLSETAPQVKVLLDDDQTLQLNLDGETQLITGTHGAASVDGWGIPWHAKNNPANNHLGYYSAALNLADPADDGQMNVPQGSGYLSVKTSSAGVVSIAGKTAAGDSITSSGGMGPEGQTALYQSLYKQKGSVEGTFQINLGSVERPAGNTLSGNLSWLKPQDTARIYAAGFDRLSIRLSGGYLAPKSSGSIVRGLPEFGAVSVFFTDGGLALSDTNPDVSSFDFSSAYKVTLPVTGLAENPARTTLIINKTTGAITGTFTLTELESTAKRKVTFRGMVVPQTSGDIKAQGYFLLPQIPLTGQKSTTSLILSGGVKISQPEVQN